MYLLNVMFLFSVVFVTLIEAVLSHKKFDKFNLTLVLDLNNWSTNTYNGLDCRYHQTGEHPAQHCVPGSVPRSI